MKVIKHLSWISSAALLSTPMFAKVAKSETAVAAKEAPVVVEEKVAPQPAVGETKIENANVQEKKAYMAFIMLR